MNVLPVGGYPYKQPGTGMEFGGNELFIPQCHLILAHRKGNGLPRATFTEVADDLEAFTCARVPGVCIDTSQPSYTEIQNSPPGPVPRPCGTCGGRRA